MIKSIKATDPVTKLFFIKSNIGDPTLEILLKNEANVDASMIRLGFFFEDGRFFYSRSKFTKKCNFFVFELILVIYNRYYRAI